MNALTVKNAIIAINVINVNNVITVMNVGIANNATTVNIVEIVIIYKMLCIIMIMFNIQRKNI